ncbi:capsular biosynthesis protein [Oleiphilus sp. HI0130]|uniref:glycosyltransferase family 2 protein n=1 Tax=Oleiphilus sp. HI0079 TaxID=1822254 RepID=UPI0007C4062D|nr:glycosyltransferase family 2 protein [Oleiphilus sp. HI0079]KZZ11281.1 capsular biosynthesis protein [Oleiphilus sp. HI0079]KZZ52460.1 capsular biosynthesis protein [Oleiphilus sp. HI0118]KZZ68261.1 capsular biosynthesis protein [Oleiphilus sp. HI0130]KZZ81503.1 capsular biosynthesis protein [Oleiphilus sp. HI0133]
MIVMPMAGLSSRFTKAGYDKPKYMLDGFGKPLFDYAVESFKTYFKTEPFLFICRDIQNTPAFVEERCKILGIVDYEVVLLTEPTGGQAETVALGLEHSKRLDDPIVVFNIDTFRRNFTFPKFMDACDGYLEVFEGEGDNWSYAKPLNKHSNKVIETAEKKPISNLCSTGLYYFKSGSDFLTLFDKAKRANSALVNNEYYIAPLYNLMIAEGADIRYDLVKNEDITFCGVPAEYDAFLAENRV